MSRRRRQERKELDKTKIDAARAALQHMDDCAMMGTAVDPVGPRGVLEQFIAEVERLADTHAVYMDQLPVARGAVEAERAYDMEKERVLQLEKQLEILHMQLAACGVVAMANTPDSAAKARDMYPEYRSASCAEVARAVDREMELRAELERLRTMQDDVELRSALIAMGWTPPETVGASCCGDPGDCARPCESASVPEQAQDTRWQLPAGLSWDQAPEWATVLVRHKDGQHAWAAAYANGARATKADRVATVTGIGDIYRSWTVIAIRPTTAAPCPNCDACQGGPHGCGKPGLHGDDAQADDAWIEWGGGKCPVPAGSDIEIKMRDGTIGITRGMWRAADYNWGHTGKQADWEIVAYRPL